MKIKFEQIEELISEYPTLVYVDRSDSLKGSPELLQQAIHEGMNCLYEENIGDLYDNDSLEHDAMDSYMNDLRENMKSKFGITAEEAEALTDEYEDCIKDVIYDRDNTDIVKELVGNTGNLTMFYSTGHTVDTQWNSSAAEIKKERMQIRRILKIRGGAHDNDIDEMLREAGYGGEVVVYFYKEPSPFMDVENRMIEFSGSVCVAVIDVNGGSGADCAVTTTVAFPFEPKNMFIDNAIKYSYSFAVCGMVDDWCRSTVVQLIEKKAKTKAAVLEVSPINEHLDLETKYNKKFAAGKCTIGDMDIRRHRDVTYINDYPCGSRCPHCGTFWID